MRTANRGPLSCLRAIKDALQRVQCAFVVVASVAWVVVACGSSSTTHGPSDSGVGTGGDQSSGGRGGNAGAFTGGTSGSSASGGSHANGGVAQMGGASGNVGASAGSAGSAGTSPCLP